MRRNWYIAFAIFLCMILFRLSAWNHAVWFLYVIPPVLLLGIYDFFIQKKHAILRNFPVVGRLRYMLEFIRPEIQQYFIANNLNERPFNREARSLVYQRAKNIRDTIPFGTENDILAVGYTWLLHSLKPKHHSDVERRITIGGDDCTQPYSSSRLNISSMSFGALSAHAIAALNKGAKAGGFAHSTGEGGLSPYHLQGGDLILQVATAYFGFRDDEGKFDPKLFQIEATRPEVKMIEIKLSQGAKPSSGGILPASKITPEIAQIRKIKPGKDVISPASHSTFHNPIGLLEFIKTVRHLSGGKPVGFKLCIGRKDQFLAICKAMLETNILPDFIVVDGAEGGTGASPVEFTNHVGEPLDTGLTFVHNALVGINVRHKIRIVCSGKVTSGYDMVMRIAMGADICNSARGMMMALGCVQSKQCNANTCPTGIATQNKNLQRGLVVDEKAVRVKQYHDNTIKSFLELVAAMGLNNPSHLKPYYIMRRLSDSVSKPLSEIYTYLKPGQLLSDDIPDDYRTVWEIASAERF